MSKHIFFLLFFLSGILEITFSQLNSTTESISNKDLDKNYSIISSRYYSYIHLFNKHLLNVFYFLDDTDVMITKTIFSALPQHTVKQRMQANKQVVLICNDKFNFGKFRCYNNISKKTKLHRIKDQQIILEQLHLGNKVSDSQEFKGLKPGQLRSNPHLPPIINVTSKDSMSLGLTTSL